MAKQDNDVNHRTDNTMVKQDNDVNHRTDNTMAKAKQNRTMI